MCLEPKISGINLTIFLLKPLTTKYNIDVSAYFKVNCLIFQIQFKKMMMNHTLNY